MRELIQRDFVWLRQHGGRNESDVEVDEIGPYVVMGAGNGSTKRVYLPKKGGKAGDEVGTKS